MRRTSSPIQYLLSYTLLIAITVLIVVPFIYMLSLSLQSEREALGGDPPFLPAHAMFSNYAVVFKTTPFGRFVLNSIIVAGGITLAHLVLDPLAGYVFAKFRFPGREPLFVAVLSTLMLPFFVRMIPLYIMMASIHWLDTYQGLIVPFITSAFGIFLFRQFIRPLPDELLHAARIDGCSEIGVYLRIVLPQIRPAMAADGLLTFIFQWNEFMWPLLATTTETMRTIPVGLTLFTREYYALWNLMAVGAVVLFFPGLLVFLLFQRFLVRSMVLSGFR
jgi:multiple sugar transport system permease protein